MRKVFNFEVRGREQLIQLSAMIAACIPKELLLDQDKIPMITIGGTSGGGKSMIAEAMMRTLMDGKDSTDMLKKFAPKKLFVEAGSGTSCWVYCKAHGEVDGRKIALGFDRMSADDLDEAHTLFMNTIRTERWRITTPLAFLFNRKLYQHSPLPKLGQKRSGIIFRSGMGKEFAAKRSRADIKESGVFSLFDIELDQDIMGRTMIRVTVPFEGDEKSQAFSRRLDRKSADNKDYYLNSFGR